MAKKPTTTTTTGTTPAAAAASAKAAGDAVTTTETGATPGDVGTSAALASLGDSGAAADALVNPADNQGDQADNANAKAAAPVLGENAADRQLRRAKLTGPAAKANAAKQLLIDSGKWDGSQERFVVIDGHSILKGGVRYLGGDHIDLPQGDADRFLDIDVRDVTDEDGDGTEAVPAGEFDTETLPPLTGQLGESVPHPDTEAGAALQKQQEQDAADREAQNLADGLPSGVENK